MPFYFFDPTYLLFMLPGLALSLWATWRTKSTFSKYSRVRTARGLTGAQAAQAMLQSAGIYDVKSGSDQTALDGTAYSEWD